MNAHTIEHTYNADENNNEKNQMNNYNKGPSYMRIDINRIVEQSFDTIQSAIEYHIATNMLSDIGALILYSSASQQ